MRSQTNILHDHPSVDIVGFHAALCRLAQQLIQHYDLWHLLQLYAPADSPTVWTSVLSNYLYRPSYNVTTGPLSEEEWCPAPCEDILCCRDWAVRIWDVQRNSRRALQPEHGVVQLLGRGYGTVVYCWCLLRTLDIPAIVIWNGKCWVMINGRYRSVTWYAQSHLSNEPKSTAIPKWHPVSIMSPRIAILPEAYPITCLFFAGLDNDQLVSKANLAEEKM